MQNNLHNSNLPDTIVGATAFEDDLAEFLLTEMTPTPKIRCDESLKTILEESSQQITFSVLQIPSHSRDRQSSTRIISRIVSKPPPNTPFVGHTSSAIPYSTYPVSLSLLQPKQKGGAGRFWLYRYAATSTYLKNHSYRKAHHGINDLLFFNVAPEMIPVEDQKSWNAAVEQTQRTFIEFTVGESPWQSVRPDCNPREVGKVGPIFQYADNGETRIYNSIEECVGPILTKQYESVMKGNPV